MNGNPEYEVKLEIFEGPLDLLLHLIRKNEVDIFDIPIALITDQYLEYLDMMKALNINVAGDFLVMASTLLHVKSKMLLPVTDEEEEDPRMEIARPLMEYLRLKELAEELSDREMLDRDTFVRRYALEDRNQYEGDGNLLDVNLFHLMDAFKRIIDQRLPGIQLSFQVEKWSLKDKMGQVMEALKNRGDLYFSELFQADRSISEFVITFLALLELVQAGLVTMYQPHADAEIRIKAFFKEEEEEKDRG